MDGERVVHLSASEDLVDAECGGVYDVAVVGFLCSTSFDEFLYLSVDIADVGDFDVLNDLLRTLEPRLSELGVVFRLVFLASCVAASAAVSGTASVLLRTAAVCARTASAFLRVT
jgi:hypothetical protein